MAAVDKTYGDALFSLVTEEDEKALPDILGQLKGVSEDVYKRQAFTFE